MSRGRMAKEHIEIEEMNDSAMYQNKQTSSGDNNDSFYIWGFFLVLAMLYVGYLCGIL